MGNFEVSISPTIERNDWGHASGGPSGDMDQSWSMSNLPTSPPPARKER